MKRTALKTGPRRHPRRRSGELEPAILDAARQIFAEKGYARATTREIAARAQIAETLLFRKFGSKAKLFAQIVVQPLEEFIRNTVQRFPELYVTDPPEIAQRRFVEELYAISRENRGLILTFFATAVFEPEVLEGNGTVRSAQRGIDELARHTENRLRDFGVNPDSFNVPLTSRMVIGMVIAMGVFGDLLLPSGARKPTQAALVNEMVRQILYGGFNQRPAFQKRRRSETAATLEEGGSSVGREGRKGTKVRRFGKIAFALIAAIMLARPAFAQESADNHASDPQVAAAEKPAAQATPTQSRQPAAKATPTRSSSESEQQRGVEEIVVTAQKRSANIQDVPIAMTVLNANEVSFRNITNLADLQYEVPGLTYGEREGGSSITIRGVGLNVNFGPVEGGVAMHIDGHYQPTITSGILGLNDLERVEVLRGPQGTLYGRNATGGAINFILKKPTDELEGGVKVGYSSFDTKKFFGYVSGPIIKGKLDGRVYGEYDASDGFIKNLTLNKYIGGHEGYGARFALLYHALENLTAEASLLTRRDLLAPAEIMVVPPNPLLELQLSIPPSSPNDFVLWRQHRDEVKEQRHGIGHKETTDLTTTVSWDTDYATVKWIDGLQYEYLQFDYDNDAEDRSTFHLKPHRERSVSLSEELDISHSINLPREMKLDWLVGGFYFVQGYDTLIDVDIDDSVVPGGIAVFSKSYEHVSAEAGFGDATLWLTHWLRAYGGLRLSFEEKNLRQSLRATVGPTRILVPTPLPEPIATIVEQLEGVRLCNNQRVGTGSNNLSPRYGVQVDATDSIMLYGQRSLGFKAGGASPFACDNRYKPEKVDSWEIGVKSQWFKRRLVANLALFDSHYTDFQVLKTTGLEGPVVNAPRATIYGMELELRSRPFEDVVQPLEALSFDASLSLLHARYNKFMDIDPANPGMPPLAPLVQNLAGHNMNRAPDHTINLGVEYSRPMPIAQFGPLRIRGEYFLTDDVYFRPYQITAGEKQKGYSLWNAYMSLSNKAENLQLSFFAKNIADIRYLENISATQIGTHYGEPGLPRTIGTELTYRF